MWEDLIKKAKDGGLDVIDTYVFWNGHEPSPGTVHNSSSFLLNSSLKLLTLSNLDLGFWSFRFSSIL